VREELERLRTQVEQRGHLAESLQRERDSLREEVAALRAENDRTSREQAEAARTPGRDEVVGQRNGNKLTATPSQSFARDRRFRGANRAGLSMARTDWPHRSDSKNRVSSKVLSRPPEDGGAEQLRAFRQMRRAAPCFTETQSGILARAQTSWRRLDPQLARSVRYGSEQVTLEGTRTVRRLRNSAARIPSIRSSP